MIGKVLQMITIHENDCLGMRVKWNQSNTFNVWQYIGDDAVEVDCFMTMEPPTLDEAVEMSKNYCHRIHQELLEEMGNTKWTSLR